MNTVPVLLHYQFPPAELAGNVLIHVPVELATRWHIQTAKATIYTRHYKDYERVGPIGYVGEPIKVRKSERAIPATKGRLAAVQEWSLGENPRPLTKKRTLYFPTFFYRAAFPIVVGALLVNYKPEKSHVRVYGGAGTRLDNRAEFSEEFKVSVVAEPSGASTQGFPWGDIVVVRSPRSKK